MWINVEYLPNINKYNTGYEHGIYVGLFLFIYMLSILYFVEKRSVCSRSEFFFLFPWKTNILNKNKIKATKKLREFIFIFNIFLLLFGVVCFFIYFVWMFGALCVPVPFVWCSSCVYLDKKNKKQKWNII